MDHFINSDRARGEDLPATVREESRTIQSCVSGLVVR